MKFKSNSNQYVPRSDYGRPARRRSRGYIRMALFVGIVCVAAFSTRSRVSLGWDTKGAPKLKKQAIAESLEVAVHLGEFPEKLNLKANDQIREVKVSYALDWKAQERIDKLIKSYSPDFAAFVAIDAETGRILTLSSYSSKKHGLAGNLALRSTFPAASLFKIVTAAAAIDQNKATADTVIAFNGANHTLYRRNVNSVQNNRWTRQMTLKEAFGKSVNTVFGKLGVFTLASNDLTRYAGRFLFNQAIASDVPIERGHFAIPENDSFAVAEVASGFNRDVTLSPLQAALMAAAVANDGTMMQPYLVEALHTQDGIPIYMAENETASVTVNQNTARELRRLMHETIRRGTSQRSFRPFLKWVDANNIELGGKTGSLSGVNPKGKYDWFVGYGISGNRKIAVAALTINENFWKVKSSYLGRVYLETYFRALNSTIATSR